MTFCPCISSLCLPSALWHWGHSCSFFRPPFPCVSAPTPFLCLYCFPIPSWFPTEQRNWDVRQLLGQPSVGWDRMMAVKESVPLIFYLPAQPPVKGWEDNPWSISLSWRKSFPVGRPRAGSELTCIPPPPGGLPRYLLLPPLPQPWAWPLPSVLTVLCLAMSCLLSTERPGVHWPPLRVSGFHLFGIGHGSVYQLLGGMAHGGYSRVGGSFKPNSRRCPLLSLSTTPLKNPTAVENLPALTDLKSTSVMAGV